LSGRRYAWHNENMRVLDGALDNPPEHGDGSGSGPQPPAGWLSDAELDHVRREVPMAYVEVVPIHVDDMGRISEVGTLTRVGDNTVETVDADPSHSAQASRPALIRSLITGRVRYGETIRQAIARSVAHDLGSMALPVLPVSLTPFYVAEFFPSEMAALRDSRQHAIALCYLIQMNGDCQPQNDALDLEWTDPTHMDDAYYRGFVNGHDRVLKNGLASAGFSLWG
jgi:hypothetical protein